MDENTHSVQSSGSSTISWTVPLDLVAIILFVVFVDALLFVTSTDVASLRAAFVLPVIVFIPGYVLVASLFPRRYTGYERWDSSGTGNDTMASSAGLQRSFRVRSIDWRARLALSFGLSLSIVPLLGLILGTVTSSLTIEPVLAGLNLFILAATGVAVTRRNRLKKEERFRVPYRNCLHVTRETVSGETRRFDQFITAFLLVTVVAAAGTMGWVLLAPQSGESYTGATLLTENSDGELTASGYPTTFTQGTGEELVVRVTNNEGVETTYTVVGELQRVDTGGDSTTITDSETVYREQETVSTNERWLTKHTVTPSMTGEDLRLAYYVYRGDTPDKPGEESAYRTLYLWVDVSASES